MTEDVIQDIFMKLWRNRAALTSIDNFSSYIFRMAQNQCITHFKRVAKETLILSRLEQPSPSATDEYLALKEVQQKIQQAVSTLTPQQKLVFTLSREKGLKHAERKVLITGEAYFEVAKNAAQPFKVTIDETHTVEVLGTHFNINAYKDEGRISTTLLEGKIKMAETMLQPGEQAIAVGNSISIDRAPDLEMVMAWKNGIFYFRNAGLELVMKQLERWYNIEVQYQGKIPEYKINGKWTVG